MIGRPAAFPAALCALGLALMGMAIFSERLGLGLAFDFLPYQWFGLPRRQMAVAGAVIAATALCWPLIRRTWANAALVFGSLTLCLVAIELILRFIDGLPLIPDRNFIAERMNATTRWQQNQHHQLLGWVLKSNLSIEPDNPHGSLTTGERGIRMNSAEIRPVPRDAIM